MSSTSQRFDYIIAGAGSSGLSLAWSILREPALSDKKLLIIDRNLEPDNDKTWCFWHLGTPPFPELIHKSWKHASVYPDSTQITRPLDPYAYHCIRSGDFRSYLLDQLQQVSRVTLLEAPITRITGGEDEAHLATSEDGPVFRADYVFQSCLKPSFERAPDYPLLQHFLGWEITANEEVFDPESFLLMDFDETVNKGIAFMYILPWNSRQALLEYTYFSKTTVPKDTYERKLEIYLNNKYGMKRFSYTIDRKEYGEIPMNDGKTPRYYAPRVVNLGMAGGVTKPSTGYTFTRIQRHSEAIVQSLVHEGTPHGADHFRSDRRYRLYDLWLLQILYEQQEESLDVFKDLFTNNELNEIFRFLGEESTFWEDLKIMASVPWRPFLKAIWQTRERWLNP